MERNNQVSILELNIQGFVLNPTLVWDDEMAVLIDTGMPGQLEPISQAMSEVGVPFEKLKAIILTHQDLDHIGSLPEIQHYFNNSIEVYAHTLDKPYIEGTNHLIKTSPNTMSEEQWAALPQPMQWLYQNPPKSEVHYTLEDGQELDLCGGIQVIFTPGHTPGHISLYVKQSKTLVAGDAMVIREGKLRGPIPQTTLDMNAAIESVKKFKCYEVEQVICYHGGLYIIREGEQFEELITGITDEVELSNK